MNFKTKSYTLIVLVVFIFSSCTQSKKNISKTQNDKLIAQVDVKGEEEKKPLLSEIISVDVGFTTIYSMIKSTEYLEMFSGDQSYTVFVPLNGAIDKLHPKTLESLKKPENVERLKSIMNCHIIPGLISKQDMVKAINEFGGSVKLKTLGGERLTATIKDDRIYMIDKNGNAGRLMMNDIEASNGIIHTIESVMMPKK